MSDGRRHSVDIPLSKTLVALRRVRSLRDPSTVSISKFSAFVDNPMWDTKSFNASSVISEGSSGSHIGSDSDLDLSSRRSDSELNLSRKPYAKRSISLKNRFVDKLVLSKSIRDEDRSRDGGECKHKLPNLAWWQNSRNHGREELDSYSEPTHGSQSGSTCSKKLKRVPRSSTVLQSSIILKNVFQNHFTSPCLSKSTSRVNQSSRSTLVTDEASYNMDSDDGECQISCCWSRTPKSDLEDRPLLSTEGSATVTPRLEAGKELMLYKGRPRSLSHKYRPQSFNDLVGLQLLAETLLKSILKGKIASIYLFHGPRGTGKTSTAKIFAASLSCLSLNEYGPCGFCRECMLFYSGGGSDIKEVDSTRINRKDKIKSLLKDAIISPISSRYKVFIIDECQLLQHETWSAILSNLNRLPRHVVFIMVTSDSYEVPPCVVSQCQRYYFPKINGMDIVRKLDRICTQEAIDFDKVALDFIAAKSNGSLRDAETMLNQLSLLGKRITLSLVYELMGIISDDVLLELLDVSFSSDASKTVKMARELMRSRVDPMQLIAQLANLIMDILSGKRLLGNSFSIQTSEVDVFKLRHALKVLSETEKQLRTAKSQTTWLTVALLQFNDGTAKSTDADNSFCSTPSTVGSLKKSSSCRQGQNRPENHYSEVCNDKRKLDIIWTRMIERCRPNTLKCFLQKEGRLSSIFFNKGLAVAEIEFYDPDHATKAEKASELIARSLQVVLHCNVEMKIKVAPDNSEIRNAKENKILNLVNCPNIKNPSNSSRSETDTNQEKNEKGSSLDRFMNKKPLVVSNMTANTLNSSSSTSRRDRYEDILKLCKSQTDTSELDPHECDYLRIEECENQPRCFPKNLKFQKICLSGVAHMVCFKFHSNDKVELSIANKSSSGAYFCTSNPYFLCSSSSTQQTDSCYSENETGTSSSRSIEKSKSQVQKTPDFSLRKEWIQHKKSHIVSWIMPCGRTKNRDN